MTERGQSLLVSLDFTMAEADDPPPPCVIVPFREILAIMGASGFLPHQGTAYDQAADGEQVGEFPPGTLGEFAP